ncbi:relaxase domain-containing protein [Klebsiella pneumoniae]|uniref:relaxase domain-containing protein n=1 Tax=Klebsiella pneumoniae TaxID=573 RepID=UPI00158F5231|nr:relaxase domain-containing protein [Klebsiella pneumoniae]
MDKALFTELLKGKLPDGSDLTRIQDGANRHRPGYDLTFSAPEKRVDAWRCWAAISVLSMLITGGNRAVRQQVESLAATRVKERWRKSETVLTGNLIVPTQP